MRSDLIDLQVEYRHQTDGAWLVSDGDREVWLPKAAVEVEASFSQLRPGAIITITLSQRLAEEKRLV